jgi:hypothetical protein
VPRPTLARRRQRLELTRALVASDLNPHYLGFWPLVRRAWAEIAGLEAVLVLVAPENEVPRHLRGDPAVHVFEPLPDVHTAFQAQCIRLLYPALLADADGAVITSDADMAPMNRRYFHRPASHVSADHFVAYRDILLGGGEIPICYNAARPATWARIFAVTSPDDVRARLAEWWTTAEYAGVHGGSGWGTDQVLLYRAVVEHARSGRDVWILDDHYTGFRRLDRPVLRRRGGLTQHDRRLISRRGFSDFHCVGPYSEFRELNDLPIELAISAQRPRTRRTTFRRGTRTPLASQKAR